MAWNYDISSCKRNGRVLVTLASSHDDLSINIVNFRDGQFFNNRINVTKKVVAWANHPKLAELDKRKR